MDCDDNEPLINPNSSEILCNGVDENCNGMQDDVPNGFVEISIDDIIQPGCLGSEDGSILITVESNVSNLNYAWSNGSSDEDLIGVGNGVYTVSIDDGTGCQFISDPIEIQESESNIEYQILSIGNNTCQGINDGLIEINIVGSSGPYEVLWNNGFSGNRLEGLSDGLYMATITDTNNCQDRTEVFEIDNQSTLEVGVSILESPSCNNDNDGLIRVSAIGGSGSYTYEWNTGNTGNTISGLSEGLYSVTVTGSESCKVTLDSIALLPVEALELTLIETDKVHCFGESDGNIYIDVSGGTKPYSYRWSNGKTTKNLLKVRAGIYTLTVTDSNSCEIISQEIRVQQNNEIQVSLDSIQNLRCPASQDGYIDVSVTGGSGLYSYNWSISDGQPLNESFISDLSPGRYFLTISDNFNCKSGVRSFELENQNIPLNLSIVLLDSLACHADSSASLVVVNNNGSFPINYNWNTGRNESKAVFSDTLNLIPKGSYNVTITDSEGCTAISDSVKITSPDPISYSIADLITNLCFGDSTATIELNIDGGSGTLLSNWNNNDTGNLITDLAAGTYQATITDNNNCQIVTSPIEIEDPNPLGLDLSISNSTTSNNGQIELFPNGGTSPYSINWPENVTDLNGDFIAINLSPDTYTIELEDINGCTLDTTVMVELISFTTDLSVLNKAVSVYPNPTASILNINYPDFLNPKKISIFSADGSLITDDIKPEIKTIELSRYDLSPGLYFLKIDFNQGSIIERFFFLK